MATITWNTDVNAPCCPGEILAPDGRSVLIQQDTDFPGVATSFGWSTRDVQKDETASDAPNGGGPFDPATGEGFCRHDGTDGTVDCPGCGIKAGAFINAAREWLEANDGAEADDPGYFN